MIRPFCVMAAPTIDFRDNATPSTVLTSIALTGSGFGGAVLAGEASGTATFRIYNNFANAGSISDAINCALATYDDAVHQGAALTTPIYQQWLQVRVSNYNGTPEVDPPWVAIGGSTRSAITANSGTLPGAGPRYFVLDMQVVVPANATAQVSSQGLWFEYSWV